MRKTAIYLLCLLACGLTLKSQTTRFVKQYDFGDVNGSYFSTDVFGYNNDFVLMGLLTNSSIGINKNAIGYIRTDSVGVLKVQKITASPNNYGFYNNGGKYFIKLKNKDILFNGMYSKAYAHTTSCLVRINSCTGDTLWTKEYKQMSDTSYLFCSAELQDSSIVSIGYKYFDNGSQFFNRPFILKTDKNGNYKWHKFLWSNTSSLFPLFSKMLNLNDKDFIVAGSYTYPTPGQKGFLIRLDTNGTIIYNKLQTHLTYTKSFVSDVTLLTNGSMLACGSIRTSYNQSLLSDFWRPWLFTCDINTGNPVTSNLYGPEKINGNSFESLLQYPTFNSIYVSGTEWFVPMNGSKLSLYKFNLNLDSLFTKYYESGQGGASFSNSMVKTNDNGLAMAMQIYPNAGQQQF